MWNQWSVGPPLPSTSLENSATLIGPVQPTVPAPNITPAPSLPGVQTMSTNIYSTSSGAPSYTPAQFAAMTPDQQYAVQQHWQQWQAYEQQYAQWHAQYGEQYKREMAAMHGTPTPAVPSYSAVAQPVTNSFSFPPPTVFPKHQAQNQAPPPPPPEETTNLSGAKALPHIYEQPPPPPPPPQTEEKRDRKSESLKQFQSLPPSLGSYPNAQFMQNQDIRWSQPPPNMLMQEHRWGEAATLVDHQKVQHPIQSNQQFNNSSQSETQYRTQNNDDIGHDNRQKNDFRNRVQNKTGHHFEYSRQQQFEDASGVNTQLERGNRNNRGVFNSNRFGNYDNQKNSGNTPWNQDNTSPEKHNVTAFNSQAATKTGNGSVDEKTFDEQFRLWEEQFENWKKENANHPDRTMYMQYEREFEKTRVRLLERREQMRRRKMLENQQKLQQIVPKEKLQSVDQTDVPDLRPKENTVATEIKHASEVSDVEKTEADSVEQEKSTKPNVVEQQESGGSKISENCGLENNMFKNKEITELFKSAGGIPGLDLVEGKDEERVDDPNEKVADPEIIDLDFDNGGFPRTTQVSSNTIAFEASQPTNKQKVLKSQLPDSDTSEKTALCGTNNSRKKIPSLLDIVVEKPHLSPEIESEYPSNSRERSPPVVKSTKSGTSRSRSISRDRDILLSPGQRSASSVSQGQTNLSNVQERSNEQSGHQFIESRRLQEQSNAPQNVSEIAKALQDPNVMQLLSVALAQAQQTGGLDQCNTQQSQLLQQLQQLQPLIQIQQERNRLPQIWSSQQSQRPQSWQQQNSTFNIKPTNSSDQNRSPWNSNPFNRNIDQKQISRGLGSGNESDGNNDAQQRNPHNPFRRSLGGFGSDNNSGGNQSFGSNLSQGSFEGTFAQQQRGSNFSGGGHFDNNRPYSTIGMSLGFRNNQNNFGDIGGNDDCYRPAQVFEYENRSRADAIVPPTKVVDYGHRPSPVVSTKSFNRDNSEFVPVKTIDYGHASSSAQVESQFSKNISYNDKKRNLEQQHQTQVSSQGHTPVTEKEKNNEYTANTIQTTSELQKNYQTSQGLNEDDKFKVIKNTEGTNDKQNEMNTDTLKKNIEGEHEYPKNKWILQNPETRERPGPPTKRGKRDVIHFANKQNKLPMHNDTEYDEIEENFEEISDNDELNETDDIASKGEQSKVKIRPLFPSVSDSITNTAMVFPSMENNNTIPIDEIIFKPGRLTRPKNIVIIIRGPPGSGKSHVAKLIKEKEIEMGGPTPRLLSIDDYFMIENDYVEKCPKSGRKIPKKEILYEYEKEMEDTYMQYLIKSFKKTISDHLFDFIIVDCCNQSLRTFNEFYNAARDGNFSPFIVDMKCGIDKCLSQNIHNRNEEDIKDIIKNYQDCPGHYIKLDVSNLLENIVEMEDVSDLEDNFVADSEVNDPDEDEEGDDINAGGFLKSKWDTDPTTENLARLDGTSKPISKRGSATLEEYLQIDGWEPPPSSTNGKKRVRWADIEEKRAQEKMRAIGFVVGQTDWSRMMDPTSGSGALTKTKYIERLNRRR